MVVDHDMLRQCATRLSRPPRLRTLVIRAGGFSSSSVVRADRAVVYAENGNPAEVLRVKSFDPLPPPPPGSVNVRFRLSPINPSDINVVQGVYPAKPASHQISGEDVFIGGNEGLAEIVDVGSNVNGLSKGDWVTIAKAQFGTWASTRVISAGDVIKLPASGLSEVNAATINVS